MQYVFFVDVLGNRGSFIFLICVFGMEGFKKEKIRLICIFQEVNYRNIYNLGRGKILKVLNQECFLLYCIKYVGVVVLISFFVTQRLVLLYVLVSRCYVSYMKDVFFKEIEELSSFGFVRMERWQRKIRNIRYFIIGINYFFFLFG